MKNLSLADLCSAKEFLTDERTFLFAALRKAQSIRNNNKVVDAIYNENTEAKNSLEKRIEKINAQIESLTTEISKRIDDLI